MIGDQIFLLGINGDMMQEENFQERIILNELKKH